MEEEIKKIREIVEVSKEITHACIYCEGNPVPVRIERKNSANPPASNE